jgi:hypothetical protein
MLLKHLQHRDLRNTCNIPLKHLKHLKYTFATYERGGQDRLIPALGCEHQHGAALLGALGSAEDQPKKRNGTTKHQQRRATEGGGVCGEMVAVANAEWSGRTAALYG